MKNDYFLAIGLFIMAVAFVFLWLVRGKEGYEEAKEAAQGLKQELKTYQTKVTTLEETVSSLQSSMIANRDNIDKKLVETQGLIHEGQKKLAVDAQNLKDECLHLGTKLGHVDQMVHKLHIDSLKKISDLEKSLENAQDQAKVLLENCNKIELNNRRLKFGMEKLLQKTQEPIQVQVEVVDPKKKKQSNGVRKIIEDAKANAESL